MYPEPHSRRSICHPAGDAAGKSDWNAIAEALPPGGALSKASL
jgi:hypothetical protein